MGSDEGFQPGRIVTYSEPDRIDLHKFYPVGDWKNNEDSMELVSETGEIKLQYNAKEVNIVTENSAELEIFLDGEPLSAEICRKRHHIWKHHKWFLSQTSTTS